jgi:hypothetical protein
MGCGASDPDQKQMAPPTPSSKANDKRLSFPFSKDANSVPSPAVGPPSSSEPAPTKKSELMLSPDEILLKGIRESSDAKKWEGVKFNHDDPAGERNTFFSALLFFCFSVFLFFCASVFFLWVFFFFGSLLLLSVVV